MGHVIWLIILILQLDRINIEYHPRLCCIIVWISDVPISLCLFIIISKCIPHFENSFYVLKLFTCISRAFLYTVKSFNSIGQKFMVLKKKTIFRWDVNLWILHFRDKIIVQWDLILWLKVNWSNTKFNPPWKLIILQYSFF